MRVPILLLALLVISGFAQAALYQITEVNPRYANPNNRGYLLVTIQNVDESPGSMVRASIQSKTSGIKFTGSYDNLGYIDWMDSRTASFPYVISSMGEGNYPLSLTVYDGAGTTDFKFNFTISKTAVYPGIVCGDSICESTENNTACPQDCKGNVTTAENVTELASYALAGSTCDIFRIDSVLLKDEADGRIDPTDKIDLGITLHSTTTSPIYDTKGFIQEDNPNIYSPSVETQYPTFGDRATLTQYYSIETKDVTPGGYAMVLKTTYIKDGRECMQLTPFNITVEGGYAFSLDLTPDSIETQPNSQLTLKAHLRNTGTRDDIYELQFRGVSNWVSQADRTVIVKAGMDKDAYIKLSVPPLTGLFDFSVEAQSRMLSQISNRDTTLITVNEPVKLMHAINLLVTDSRSMDVVRGEGGIFNLRIQNAGNLKDTISLKATGADWAFLKPDTLTLEPGQTEELAMYVAPTDGTETGTYTLTIKATTPGGEASAEETVAVYVADKKITKTFPKSEEAGEANASALTGLVVFAKGAAVYGGTPLILGILVIIALALAFLPKREESEELRPLKGR